MSSEVEAPQAPTDPTPDSRSESKEKEPTWKQHLLIASVGALVGALVTALGAYKVAEAAGEYSLQTAEVTGKYLMRNSENEFLREQQIAAYGNYIEDLLILEEKYRESVNLLQPVETTDKGQTSEGAATSPKNPSDLRRELDVAMNELTQTKSVVDVVGPDAVKQAAQTAIDCYGPLKGDMQNHLAAPISQSNPSALVAIESSPKDAKKAVPCLGPTFDEALDQMQKVGRDFFTDEARKSLNIPETSSSG